MFSSYSAMYDEKSTDSYFYLGGLNDLLKEEEYAEYDEYDEKSSIFEDDVYYDELTDYYDSYYDDYNDH